MGSSQHLTVLYDAECARCSRIARWIERRDRKHTRMTCRPLQDAEPPPAGLTRADLERELHAIDTQGRVFAGWSAVVAIARRIPMLAWLVPLSHLPGGEAVGRWLYRRVAAGRGCADCVDTPVRFDR